MNRIRIKFGGEQNRLLRFDRQYDVYNGFLHNLIEGEKYYKGPSDFNVSFQGGRMDSSKRGITFRDYPLVMEVAVLDNDYMYNLLKALAAQEALPRSQRLNICGMMPTSFELVAIPEFKDGADYFFTSSPVLIKLPERKNTGVPMYVTCQHDDCNEILTSKVQSILSKVDDSIDRNNLNVEFVSDEIAKELGSKPAKVRRFLWHGQEHFASQGIIRITGSAAAKTMLMKIGVANSTGSGFGMVRPYNIKKEI